MDILIRVAVCFLLSLMIFTALVLVIRHISGELQTDLEKTFMYFLSAVIVLSLFFFLCPVAEIKLMTMLIWFVLLVSIPIAAALGIFPKGDW